MTKVKVSIEGHYEVEDFSYGKDYKCMPAHALIQCDCGQTMDADAHHTTCSGCGADHTEVVREVAGRHLGEEVLHPWHAEYEEWVRFKEGRHDEREEWLEQRGLE